MCNIYAVSMKKMVLTQKRGLDPKLSMNISSLVPEYYEILHEVSFWCLEGIYLNLISKVCALLYNRISHEQNLWNNVIQKQRYKKLMLLCIILFLTMK